MVLISFTLFILPIVAIFLWVTLMPESKPATKETRKELLLSEYNLLKKSNTQELLKALKLLERNRSNILKLLTDRDALVSLDKPTKGSPLPIDLLDKLKKISKDYALKINKERAFSLIKTRTDYTNYLYIIHTVSRANNLSESPNNSEYTERIMLDDRFEYRVSIKDAFSDIDPNNFAPN